VKRVFKSLLSGLFSSDWHLHDSFSHDGHGQPVDFARQAYEKGILSIGITNHIEEYDLALRQYDIVFDKAIKRISESYAAILQARKSVSEVEIRFGVEFENNARCYPVMERILSEIRFDYVIGSVHVVKGVSITDPDCLPFLRQTSPERMMEQYYREMTDFLEWGRFDYLGHTDIARRYLTDVYPGFKPSIPYDVLRNVFSLLCSRGQGIEINTAGLFHAPQDTYPTLEIIELALDCGVERWMAGSDAHCPENVGRGFNEAKKSLTC